MHKTILQCGFHPTGIIEVFIKVLAQVTDDQRYMFKAPFKLRDKKSLLKLLKRRDLNGEGGVFFDDVNESLPKAEKIVQSLTGDGKIIQVRNGLVCYVQLIAQINDDLPLLVRVSDTSADVTSFTDHWNIFHPRKA